MASSFLWLGTLGALYLFFIFSTPVKAPAPDKFVKPSEIAKAKEAEGETKKVEVADTPVHTAETMDPKAMIAKGKEVYTKNCLTCHNKDPNVKGAIGPELVDAPLEVMLVKVKTGRYPDVLPAGFVPKRNTKQMRKFPQLEADVPSIHAYIQSLKKK